MSGILVEGWKEDFDLRLEEDQKKDGRYLETGHFLELDDSYHERHLSGNPGYH